MIGRAQWYESVLEHEMELPFDKTQLPDVFINVMENGKRRSFLRYRP
jgi:hypothetical protein